jgi:catechol 2,3-dioxygenase-like lactoylglutathione lyase family enzyme
MGKINLRRVYHIGISVNDLERAERFYVDVLGMKVHGNPVDKDGRRNYRVSDDNQPWRDILGYWPEALRLRCGNDSVEVVLVKRPKPIARDWKEDSFNHTAFSASREDFDLFLERAKEWGVNFHLGPVGRKGSRTLYFFDPDGNYIQLDDRG